jgi:hypothetical protein
MRKRIVECGKHGESGPALVCCHLAASLRNGATGLGFFTPDPQDAEPQAWCAECDAALTEEGEWNDRSEAVAGVTVICQGCFEDARALNAISQPS